MNEDKERKQQELKVGLLAMADKADATKKELVNKLNSTQKIKKRVVKKDINMQSSQLKDRLKERQMSKDWGVSFRSQVRKLTSDFFHEYDWNSRKWGTDFFNYV